jgi:cell division septation protein DedD
MRGIAVAVLILLSGCASVRHSKTYFVNVATFWQPRQANILNADLLSHGYPSFIDERFETLRSAKPIQMIVAAERGETYPTTTRYRVRVGPFYDSAEADHARDELRAAGYRAYIVRN